MNSFSLRWAIKWKIACYGAYGGLLQKDANTELFPTPVYWPKFLEREPHRYCPCERDLRYLPAILLSGPAPHTSGVQLLSAMG